VGELAGDPLEPRRGHRERDAAGTVLDHRCRPAQLLLAAIAEDRSRLTR
jgi:hypothetical protein